MAVHFCTSAFQCSQNAVLLCNSEAFDPFFEPTQDVDSGNDPYRVAGDEQQGKA
jgi:hypothetical protein